MNEIKCPYDLNQFILGELIFENSFPEEECEQKKFYDDCYHCFSTAIASRDHQLKYRMANKIKAEIKKILDVNWSDGLYQARYFIRELLKPLSATVRLGVEAKVPQCTKRSTCTLSTLISLNAAFREFAHDSAESGLYGGRAVRCA